MIGYPQEGGGRGEEDSATLLCPHPSPRNLALLCSITSAWACHGGDEGWRRDRVGLGDSDGLGAASHGRWDAGGGWAQIVVCWEPGTDACGENSSALRRQRAVRQSYLLSTLLGQV
jgi:hypothetical protein